jgi:gamma-glutamyl-gamma-aminobutyrate hydrolase PuuD
MGNAHTPVIGVVGHWITRDGERHATAKEKYLQAVRMGGGLPVLLVPECEPKRIAGLLDGIDGVLLTGGYDVDPAVYGETVYNDTVRIDGERDTFELPLARLAHERDVPLLAICRGCQVLNVALGGDLWQDIPSQIPDALSHRQHAPMGAVTHAVQVRPDSFLARAIGPSAGSSVGPSDRSDVQTNTAHHQAVRQVAPSLVASAHSDDGLIEAVEAPDRRFVVGVQWHPESLAEAWPEQLRLFQALVQAARCV